MPALVDLGGLAISPADYRSKVEASYNTFSNEQKAALSSKLANARQSGVRIPAFDGNFYTTTNGKDKLCNDFTGQFKCCGGVGHDVPQCKLNQVAQPWSNESRNTQKRSAAVLRAAETHAKPTSLTAADIQALVTALRPAQATPMVPAAPIAAVSAADKNDQHMQDLMTVLSQHICTGNDEVAAIARRYTQAPVLNVGNITKSALHTTFDKGYSYMNDTGARFCICSYSHLKLRQHRGEASELLPKTPGVDLKSCSKEDESATASLGYIGNSLIVEEICGHPLVVLFMVCTDYDAMLEPILGLDLLDQLDFELSLPKRTATYTNGGVKASYPFVLPSLQHGNGGHDGDQCASVQAEPVPARSEPETHKAKTSLVQARAQQARLKAVAHSRPRSRPKRTHSRFDPTIGAVLTLAVAVHCTLAEGAVSSAFDNFFGKEVDGTYNPFGNEPRPCAAALSSTACPSFNPSSRYLDPSLPTAAEVANDSLSFDDPRDCQF